MSVESWIDALAKRWEISDGKGGTVRSYRVYEKDEFPESISLEKPCVITYITGYDPQYSAGGPLKGLYRGTSEFHLVSNVNKANLPKLMLYLARIRNAAAGSIQLGGLVDHFLLVGDPPIRGPVSLQYGSEEPHHGIVVTWEVKADEASDTGYTVAI